jgi:uncharacterized protein YaeQ
VALGATMYVFEIRLADADRGVYENLTIRAARHPSETAEFLVTRLLAFCLEYEAGIVFSSGLSTPDEPALSVRDLTGALQHWIEIGAPDADRLHKAAKAAPRVTVYTHRDIDSLLARLAGTRIHRASARWTATCWRQWWRGSTGAWTSILPSRRARCTSRLARRH